MSMGTVEPEATTIKLATNSPQRAHKGQPTDDGPGSATTLSPTEERTIVHEVLERPYRGLLVQPVPMLGNVSPRGSRLSVEFVIGLLAAGWSETEIVENSGHRPRRHPGLLGVCAGHAEGRAGISQRFLTVRSILGRIDQRETFLACRIGEPLIERDDLQR
jgi:hypothetical protein